MVVNGLGLTSSAPVSFDWAVLRFASDRLNERMSRKLERADAGGLLPGEEVTLPARLVFIGPFARTLLAGDLEKELCVDDESSDVNLRLPAMDVRARGTAVVGALSFRVCSSTSRVIASDWTEEASSNPSDDACRETRALYKTKVVREMVSQ